MRERNELQKQQEGTDHDPYADIRKIVYDCVDQRIVNIDNPDVPLYMIINQHGFLGYITEELNGEYKGYLNDATRTAFNSDFGCVYAKSFDDCIKGLTDFHVKVFHDQWKKILTTEDENEG